MGLVRDHLNSKWDDTDWTSIKPSPAQPTQDGAHCSEHDWTSFQDSGPPGTVVVEKPSSEKIFDSLDIILEAVRPAGACSTQKPSLA